MGEGALERLQNRSKMSFCFNGEKKEKNYCSFFCCQVCFCFVVVHKCQLFCSVDMILQSVRLFARTSTEIQPPRKIGTNIYMYSTCVISGAE